MKKSLLAVFLCCSLWGVSAQERTTSLEEKASPAYRNNWFVSLGGGINLLAAEQDFGNYHHSITDRFCYGVQLTAGKWFTHSFGARLQGQYSKLRGFNKEISSGYYFYEDRSTGINPKTYPPNYLRSGDDQSNYGFWQDFSYSLVTFDLMVNLSNLLRSYPKQDALLDIIPYAGAGIIHAYEGDQTISSTDLAIKFGIRADFNLNPRWSLYLEPQAVVAPKEFDGYVGTRSYDAILNLYAGVQFNINKKIFSTPQSYLSSSEIELLQEKIRSQEEESRAQAAQLSDLARKLEEQTKQLNKVGERPVSVIGNSEVATKLSQSVDSDATSTPANKGREEDVARTQKIPVVAYESEPVYFSTNSFVISQKEQAKIRRIADFLKSHPDLQIRLIGFADETGKFSHNILLSRDRVKSVKKELSLLGVPVNRLIEEWRGSEVKLSPVLSENRVVIAIGLDCK
ncbi:MAG: OmpA family protein [Dysgonamonadaceae bacterium]|jgi:outer membrane protein OmpA-like peptidoglycan-associated protein|nr:OmpA family protein [Dysgonamonadaceae bacterium]